MWTTHWFVARDSEANETICLGTNKLDAAFRLRRLLRERPNMMFRDPYGRWSAQRYAAMMRGRIKPEASSQCGVVRISCTTVMIRTVCLLSLMAALATAQPKPGRKWTTVERLDAAHLRAVHEARQRFAAARRELPSRALWEDYRAVLHIHAEDAPHTAGTRAEVLEAARKTGVRIVVFSDHDGIRPDTWRGMREGVLFIPGAEFGSGHLFEAALTTRKLRFLSHPEGALEAATAGLDGMEIYNRHADAMDEEEFTAWFRAAMKNPEQRRAISGNLAAYPDEFFGSQADYWPSVFGKWDRETATRHFTGIAANDAHHNQRYQGLDLDPYDVSFRNVSTHLLARELSEREIREALGSGRVYVAHDWLADPTGFLFVASNNLGVFDMGDPVPLVGSTRLTAQLPLEARLKLFHNGKIVEERTASELSFTAKEPGAYRLEAWLAVDGEERPWIYSNPVYLEKPGPEAVWLPSNEISPGVEVIKDVAYTAGKPEDEAKHKLDLYLPKGKQGFPVFVFIHGGSWRSGDRSRYVALGNRFAAEGLGTVIPSYRLAPQNPHPAQIEDVAAAFAWTVRNIERHGGRSDRIFVGGHSAGGHLAALLSLDARYLAAHDLTPAAIRGTAALSGVYEIRGLEAVFGKDAAAQKQASPLTHVQPGAAPFLVAYCQWDYPSLPAQAKIFHASLRRAGIDSQLLYVPRENHISEIVNVARGGNPMAQALLDFFARLAR